MSLLENITSPADLKNFSYRQLEELSEELRHFIIQVVSRNGGHLASNLGIVELTLAIHRVFDSSSDRIIFDVGHQCYVHKILTGRRDQFPTMRTLGGLSGFPKGSESQHDAFDTGHSSTSISAGLGMAIARQYFGQSHSVVALIGDGAMSGGMAFEAMNHAGHQKSDMVVILNDNEMSISPNVGAMAHYLHKIRMEPAYTTPKEYLRHIVKTIPAFGQRIYGLLSRMEGSLKYLLTPGVLFEEFGFRYLGPVNGYDFPTLEKTLAFARDRGGPILVHVLTEKGRGYNPAKERLPLFHGVGPFEITTGKIKVEKAPPSFTTVFGETLVEIASEDSRVVAITAAMKEGTGLLPFAQHFPERFFDVGIAECHAVTMAAGMAKGGLRPFVAIYSTFMQRAYDQIIHDVALMNLPVVFCLDRAGIVGEDGPTHHGLFDIAYLRMIPNLTILAPKDEAELRWMLKFAAGIQGPVALRYPRGAGIGTNQFQVKNPILLGKAEMCREGSDVAILALGNTLYPALEAADQLFHQGIDAMVVNPRFVKPIDTAFLDTLLLRRIPIVTIEEGVLAGGFGASIAEYAVDQGVAPKILRMGVPDMFVPQGSPSEIRKILGLDSEALCHKIAQFVRPGKAALPQTAPAKIRSA